MAKFPEKVEAQIEARNQELLTLRDGALLLAYRFVGGRGDAEDVLQEAYLKAVRVSEPLLTGQPLRKWFFQITANAAINYLRSEQRRRNRERSVAMSTELAAMPARSGPEADELKQSVETELANLDEKYRTVISLHYDGGFSYDEVSEILGMPAGTARAYSSQGLKLLRERLDRPGRVVTAEVLLALLAAGATLTASPAFAATVQTIVAAKAAATGTAAAAGGAKTFLAAKGVGISAKMIAASVVLALSMLGGLIWTVWGRMQARPNFANAAETPLVRHEDSVKAQDEVEKAVVLDAQPVGDHGPLPFVQPRVVEAPKELVEGALKQIAVDGFPAAGDYLPPPEVEAEWANSIDLMKGIEPKRDAVVGVFHSMSEKVQVEPGVFATQTKLRMDRAKFGRLAIPCKAPEEYDYRVDFTRTAGWLNVDLVFSLNGKSGAWIMGALDGSTYCFGHHRNNVQIIKAPRIANNLLHTCIVKVRKKLVTAYLDGNLIQSIDPTQGMWEATTDLRLPDQSMLGVGAWDCGVLFHRVALREITGKAEWVDMAARAPKDDAEYWQNAKSLMPAAVNAGNALDGQWSVVNGELSVKAVPACCRYQLDYAPPEEYDMLMEFTRPHGNRGIVQILAAEGRQFMWRMDMDGISGLDQIGGAHFYDGPTIMQTPGMIQNGVKHRSIVCVRKDRIRIYVDGKMYLDWEADYKGMNLGGGWDMKSKDALGVGSMRSNVTIHKIVVKEVTGAGRTLAAPAAGEAVRPPKEGDF